MSTIDHIAISFFVGVVIGGLATWSVNRLKIIRYEGQIAAAERTFTEMRFQLLAGQFLNHSSQCIVADGQKDVTTMRATLLEIRKGEP